MKTTLRLPVTLFAVVVLAAATTGASFPRATGRTQTSESRPSFLTPPTSAEAGCTTDATLCLQEGRFLVQAT